MDRAAIIDKLRKVRALARHGDSGEKTAAEATLRRLLDRHGITETELDPPADPPTWRRFTYGDKDERTLLNQCVAKITGQREFEALRHRGTRTVEYCLTAAQDSDVGVLHALAVRRWRQEKARFLAAFILRHDLTSGGATNHDDAETPDADEIAAIRAFMAGIDEPLDVRRALPGA